MKTPQLKKRRVLQTSRTLRWVRADLVLEDGRTVPWEIVEHPGAAAILPVYPDGDVILLRQYRPSVGEWLWEIPCGTLKPGERPIAAAHRELAEEAGVRGTLRKLTAFYTAPGFCTEKMHCFVATRLEPAPINRDAEERIRVHRVPLARALRWADGGKIPDAKTLVCLRAWASRVKR